MQYHLGGGLELGVEAEEQRRGVGEHAWALRRAVQQQHQQQAPPQHQFLQRALSKGTAEMI